MSVNVGIIGAGYWGSKLIREYTILSGKRHDLRLGGIADSSQQQLREIASKNGLPDNILHLDYHDIINDPSINAVHIATPNEIHYEVATEALKMGKNVLLEKPMALSTRDAFKMMRLAEEKNLVLLVGHIFRFSNVVNALKKLLSDGVLGRIHYVNLRWSTSMIPPKDRDIIWDLAPHPVDIMNFLLDEWPVNVYARAESYLRQKMGLEEAAFILADLPEGKMASIMLSWIQPGPKIRDLTLVGSSATAYTDVLNQKISLYTDINNPEDFPVVENNTIETMINHYVDRIVNGDPPRNSALIGSLTVSVLESIRKSLEINKPVPVMSG